MKDKRHHYVSQSEKRTGTERTSLVFCEAGESDAAVGAAQVFSLVHCLLGEATARPPAQNRSGEQTGRCKNNATNNSNNYNKKKKNNCFSSSTMLQ